MKLEPLARASLAVAAVFAAGHFVGAAIGDQWTLWITKPVPVACLIAALPWAARFGRDPYRDRIAIGFVFSIAGDVFLMLPGDWFVHGLASFLVGHLFYVAAFGSALPAAPATSDATASAAKPAWSVPRLIPFAIFGLVMLAVLWPRLGEMRVPVLAYMAVILTMGWRAACRFGAPGELRAAHWAGLLGAISFIVSDSFIAIGKFHTDLPAERYLIMGTYWAGQLGIGLSARRTG